MNRIYRYRLYPTRKQIDALEGQLAFACDLYNAALQQRRDAWRYHGKSVRLKDQQHELTEARRDGPATATAGANSGIFYLLTSPHDPASGAPLGLEYQILRA